MAPKNNLTEKRKIESRQSFNLYYIIWFFGGFILLGLVAIMLYKWSAASIATAFLWVMACQITGAAIGFLFGIPKIFQSNQVKETEANLQFNENNEYQQRVNTNLTEISDWLTKIIVGLGLINLTKIPPYLYIIATTLASGLNPKEPKLTLAFAYGIILCYTILGFLFGYIATRLFLAGAFSRADQQALSSLKTNYESQQAQIAVIESNQSLINQSLYSDKNLSSTTNSNAEVGHVESNGQQPDNLKQLETLATNYLKISNPDWGERVRLKDEAANEMGSFALRNGIKKDDIVALAEATVNEGLILALAMVISVRPELGDFDKLLRVASMVSRLHIRHKVLVSIGKLFKLGLINPVDRQRAVALINNVYRRNADPPLLKMIDTTLSLINTTEILETHT